MSQGGPQSIGVGSQFRSYAILGEIARGGQGVVLRARHHPSGHPVALKLLLDPTPPLVKRFHQEARVLQSLDHPNVLRVVEYGDQAGTPFLATELVEGKDVAALVKEGGIPPLEWTARVVATVAYTLEHCHRSGVIHRDLKPANILVEASSQRPVLVDFGLVKRDPNELHLASLDEGSVLSQSGSIKGTPEYMAPEQVNPKNFGQVSPRTDVYGLGATLYHLLTGRPPFKGGAAVLVMRKVTRKAPEDPTSLNPAVPPEVAALCLASLAKASDERPASAAAFGQALAQAAGVEVPIPRPRPGASRISSRHLQLSSSSGSHTTLLPSRLPQPGDELAGCRIVRELGRGGMGAVYEALRPDGSRVALKVILGDSQSGTRRERFLREAQVGKELQHPGVVQVHGRGEERGMSYLVMELVEGALPLDEYVKTHGLAVPARVQLMLHVAEALEAAHHVELIHRDLKPENVLVTPEGEVKVLDFGLALHLDKERLTLSGQVMGTVSYMAPEQVMGKAHESTPRTDVWAMGVMLFELVRGELPFRGDTNLEVMASIIEDEPPDPCEGIADAPHGLSAVIRVALAKSPQDRYPNAAGFGRDLVAASSGSGHVAAIDVLKRSSRRRWLKRAFAALAIVFVLAAMTTLIVHRASQLGPDEAKEQAAAIDADARDLLAGPDDRFLAADDEQTAAVAQAMAELEEEAPGDVDRAALDKTARRVRTLEGLTALARGDTPGAVAALEDLDQVETVEAGVLRGALATVLEQGDPREAVQLIGRGLARGIDRPELRGWRVQARLRVGLQNQVEAQEVLDDLQVLKRARGGTASSTDQVARAWALLTLGDLDGAGQALETVEDPPLRLQWAVGLERAGKSIKKDPQRALEIVRGLPATQERFPRRLALDGKVRALIAKAAFQKYLPPADMPRIEPLYRLARLLGQQELRPKVITELIEHTTGYKVGDPDEGVKGLVMALSELRSKDLFLQTRVAGLLDRVYSVHSKLILLPALRRAIPLEDDPAKRLVLQVELINNMGWMCGKGEDTVAKECVTLAGNLLPRIDIKKQRAQVLGARAQALYLQRDLEGALRDVSKALEEWEEPHLLLVRAMVLVSLKRQPKQAQEDAAKYVIRLNDATSGGEHALGITWDMGRPPAQRELVRGAIRHMLVYRPYLAGWQVRIASLALEAGDRKAAIKHLELATHWFAEGPRLKKIELIQGMSGRAREVLSLVQAKSPRAKQAITELIAELDALRSRAPNRGRP